MPRTQDSRRMDGFPAYLNKTVLDNLSDLVEMGPKDWTITSSEKLKFRLMPANTPDLRRRVYRLGSRVYADMGYSKIERDGLLYCRYDALPETLPLLVTNERNQDVATLTLVFDGSKYGLPLEDIFPSEIHAYRRKEKKGAEIMRLAIDKSAGAGKEILLHLFNFSYIYARLVQDCDGFLITVNPKHEPYYRRALHFKQMGSIKPCPKVNNAPAALLHLCFDYAAAKVEREAGKQIHTKEKRSLYPHLFPSVSEPFIAKFLKHRHNPMTKQEMFDLGL